jgi:type IV pilus assembly protein PilB
VKPEPYSRKKLGEILVECGLITAEQIGKALRTQKANRKRLGEIIVESGFCTENAIATTLADQLGLRLLDLKVTPIEQEAIQLVPEKIARKHLIVPVSVEKGSFHLAMADPLSLEAIDDCRFISNLNVLPWIATKADIVWAINHHYHLGESLDSIVKDIVPAEVVQVVHEGSPSQSEIEDLKRKGEAAPIVRIVDYLLSQATGMGASDIHVEPEPDKLLVRYRIDGMLRKGVELPKWTQAAIVSRIKIMSKMDIAEKRKPQDGRICVTIQRRNIDLRVSVIPAHYGEKAVMRLLDPKSSLLSVDQLGMSKLERRTFLSFLDKPQGIVLVSGPTGSGKTTTLYAALSKIRQPEINLITLEDPIEYELGGVSQVQINDQVGMSFANTMRYILRQDPDVIMIGEMRDHDTAAIAMQAALTGHKVFSTIHTNNSVATITRLRNLGIPDYLIASTLNGIIAQRLVRTICPKCRTEDRRAHEKLIRARLFQDVKLMKNCFVGNGCDTCSGSGYLGRTGVYEILPFTSRVRDVVSNNGSEGDIKQVLRLERVQTLLQSGLKIVQSGRTSVDELIRVVQVDKDSLSTCSGCGYLLGQDFAFCPECSKRVSMNCTHCRKIIAPPWKYCPYCSVKVEEVSKRKPPPPGISGGINEGSES